MIGALVHICRTVVNSPIDGLRDDGFSERLSKTNVLSDGRASNETEHYALGEGEKSHGDKSLREKLFRLVTSVT